MNSSKFRFVLDLQSTQSQISIPVTRGDTARVWHISLADGGQPYVLEDGCLAKIEIKRPVGTFLEAFCAIENKSVIIYDFAQDTVTMNTATSEGIHECAIVLYDTKNNKLGTARFSMVVSDRVVNTDDINISVGDLNAIDAMIAKEAERQEAEKGRVNAEAQRKANEELRNSTLGQLSDAIRLIDNKINSAIVATLNSEV